MTSSKPNNKFPAMKADTMLERVMFAAALLHIHEFSSDSEDAKIKTRIRKWVEKHRQFDDRSA
jgi:hypothetical protein